MYKLSGFIKIDNQINNTLGVVSMLGELSTYSMTFSKEKGFFVGDYAPGLTFVNFTSKQDNTINVAVPPDYVTHVLQIANHAIEYSKTFGISVTTQDIAAELINQYPALINNLELGPIVNTATLAMPEWISWINPVLQGGNNRIRIWFSDQAFKRQYDDYEVVILNPVDDMMDLVRQPAITQAALDKRSDIKKMELISVAKQSNPETIIRAQTYTLTNLLQPSVKFNVTWYAIIYGNAGDNPDIIKQAIIQNLDVTNGVTLEEWRQAIPDLFMTTEFLMYPMWTHQAIADRTVQAGIYSPFGSVKKSLDDLIEFYNDIDSTHIEENLQSLNIPYRSLTMYSLSSVDNLNNLFKLTDAYSDLISVGTSSPDFARMSKKTQEFAIVLEEMIIIAENEKQYAELPSHTRRSQRYGKTWITRNHDGIQFLIYAKSNDIE